MKNKLFYLFLLSIIMGCAEDQVPSPTLPNILFIYTDDQTYHSIQALGNEEIQTPNLDRLSQMGTTFTHAFNMGGWHGAICVASRSMIISGQTIWDARAMERRWINKDPLAIQQTWGQLMSDAGYRSYMSGKWHIAAPVDSVFDQTGVVQKGGMPPDAWTTMTQADRQRMRQRLADGEDFNQVAPIGYARPMDENDTLWTPTDTAMGGFWTGGQHWSEVLRDDAIQFMQSAEQDDRPFFMYLAFNAPHDSRQAPQKYQDMYPLDSISLPPSFQPEYPYKDQIGNQRTLRDEALAPFPRTEYAVRKHRQEYYAIISHLDAQIGAIIDRLEASGLMDNTYILYTADHGLSVGHHGLLGKQSLFDHSIRVPLIIAGKDIPKGQKIDSPVYLQDLMATSLELAKTDQPEYVAFNSLLPLAKGENQSSAYDAIYGAYMDLQRMIRKDDYKLILYPKVPKVLLFNLKDDPYEMNNLAEELDEQSRIKDLFGELQTLQTEMKDTLNLNRYFDF
jgi:arylsulfatase A-like enzyme